MSWVLGISDSVHDQSVALFKDNELITMIELERLTRVKHGIRAKANVDFAKDDDLNYFGELNLEHKPQKETEEDLRLCIDYCLNVAGIKYDDLDLVPVGTIETSDGKLNFVASSLTENDVC